MLCVLPVDHIKLFLPLINDCKQKTSLFSWIEKQMRIGFFPFSEIEISNSTILFLFNVVFLWRHFVNHKVHNLWFGVEQAEKRRIGFLSLAFAIAYEIESNEIQTKYANKKKKNGFFENENEIWNEIQPYRSSFDAVIVVVLFAQNDEWIESKKVSFHFVQWWKCSKNW